MSYTIHAGPEQRGVTAATLRVVEEYWLSRIRALEDEFRRHQEAAEAHLHKLELQVAAMHERWPHGWEGA